MGLLVGDDDVAEQFEVLTQSSCVLTGWYVCKS